MLLPEQSEIVIAPSGAISPAEFDCSIANQKPRSIFRNGSTCGDRGTLRIVLGHQNTQQRRGAARSGIQVNCSAARESRPTRHDHAVNFPVTGNRNIINNPCATGPEDFEHRQQCYVQFPREKFSRQLRGNIRVEKSRVQAPD